MTASTHRRAPQQARSRETVAVILEAAGQVFTAEGYDATTNRIAERAGVSVGSIYAYFPDKDALLTALATHHLDIASEVLHATLDHLDDTEADLPTSIEVLVRGTVALHADQPTLHAVLSGVAPLPPATMARVNALLDELAQRMATRLSRLGVGGREPNTTARLAVDGVTGQVHGALLALDPVEREAATVAAIELWVAALTSDDHR